MKGVNTAHVIHQLIMLRDLHDCDMYNITLIRELSYMEGFEALYKLASESPDKYYNLVSNGSQIDV